MMYKSREEARPSAMFPIQNYMRKYAVQLCFSNFLFSFLFISAMLVFPFQLCNNIQVVIKGILSAHYVYFVEDNLHDGFDC